MNTTESNDSITPSQQITDYIAEWLTRAGRCLPACAP